VARNVAASLGVGAARRYRHHDLGLVADLGGNAAVARVLGVTLKGRPAKVVARAYYLYALPSVTCQVRVATDWAFASLLPTQVVKLAPSAGGLSGPDTADVSLGVDTP
jgi:NADH dehydrogenase